MPDIVFHSGDFTTLDPDNPRAEAVTIRDGKFVAVGTREEAEAEAKEDSHAIDLQGRLAVPGLHDSHLHLVRGGLHYNLELRWDGVPSLSDGLRMLRTQVENTPPPQWVRVVGGFTLHQFAEKRLPTLDELNAIAPDTPVFILHLYDRALLNRAALHVCGYTKDSVNPPGGEIERDHRGEPTGMLIATPTATLLYAALAKGPKLSTDDQVNSTRMFMRELNRLGITSAIDAGGGFQNYPEDYAVIEKLARNNELTVRIAYNLFTQHPDGEYADFEAWTQSLQCMDGDNYYRHNGAGEMLVFSAADFEDFRQPRPDMPPQMEGQLEKVVRLLSEKRWPFRLHATYNETIERALNVFEKVNKDIPFNGLHWFFDHAETISDANIDRVAALGGGISVQHRMAYQGEFFVERYGQEAAARTPPIQRMLSAGLPLAAGTDATRIASYNPWVCLYWLVTGKTVGGMELYGPEERLDRATALRLYTQGPAWFANTTERGQIKAGQCADFIVPSADYFQIPAEAIRYLTSDLTVLGGRIVYADGDFRHFALPMPQVSPRWSPVRRAPGYHVEKDILSALAECAAAGGCACGNCGTGAKPKRVERIPFGPESLFWDAIGCQCWI